MSTMIVHPFKIYASSKDGQQKICDHMNQMAFAEKEKDPNSLAVRVMPVEGNPLPVQALVSVAGLAKTFSSSYMGGLHSMVLDEAREAAAAAQKKSGTAPVSKPAPLVRKGP